MKKIILFVVGLSLFLLTAGCGTGKENPTPATGTNGITAQEVRVATQPSPVMAPIFVAKQKGWLEEEFKKVGVTVKWSSFTAGPPMNESFAAGQQDIGFLGDSAAIIPKSAGQNIRIVSVAGAAPKGLALMVAKDSNIAAVSDLKGKKVAVVKGSYAHHLVVLALKNAGLTTDDIQLLNMTPADIGTALAKGDVDAGAVWEPLLTQLEDKDGTGIKKGLLVIVANDNFAVKNPELVKIFLKVYQRSSEFIKANPQEAAELIADEVKLAPDQLVKVLAKFDFEPGIRADDIAELKVSEEFMRTAGIIKTRVDIDSFIDNRYARDVGF